MAALQGAGTPASTVFVGNLAYDLSEQDVIDYFSKVGPVKAVRIVTERDSGKPRGFGFIEFHDVATAESCIRNMSGSELNGRTIRIVFAEGGPGDFRPRMDERADDRGPRRPAARSKLVGGDLAYHSSQGMAVLLGSAPQPGAPPDQLTGMLARKTRSELYEYLAQMQSLLRQNPQQARQVLIDNPQLARALFHMEIILGMVSNPLGDVAPKGAAPAGILPPRHHDAGPPPGMEPYGAPPGPPPPYGMAPPPMGHYPPPEPMRPVGPPPMDPRLAGPPPVDPRMAPPMGGPPPPHPVPMAPAPRPMVSMAAGAPPPAAAAVPGMSADQQQALLQQVMSLTPEQIELLPPEQKAQVLALQAQLRGQGR